MWLLCVAIGLGSIGRGLGAKPGGCVELLLLELGLLPLLLVPLLYLLLLLLLQQQLLLLKHELLLLLLLLLLKLGVFMLLRVVLEWVLRLLLVLM